VSLLLAAALMACGGDAGNKSPTPPVSASPTPPGGGGGTPPTAVLSSINMNAPSSSIAIGGAVQVDASPRDQNSQVIGAAVTWSSSNDTVATVTGAGLVTGLKAGSATISASAVAGSVTLTRSIGVNVILPFAGPPPPKNVPVNDPRGGSLPNLGQYEPSVAVSGARIVVGWNDESYGSQTVRGVNWSVAYGYSTNGGSTFTEGGEVGSTHWGADPSVTVNRAGNFYFGRFELTNDLSFGISAPDRVAIYKSTDGGITFPQSAFVTGNTSGGFQGVNDKPTITADNTGSVFDGNVYASWTFASSNVLKIRFARSTDGGASFSAPMVLSDGTKDQGSVPVVGPGGVVHVLWVDIASNTIFVRKSIDGGVTFAPAVSVASSTPIGANEGSTSQYCGPVLNGSIGVFVSPIIAVDKSGGPNNGKLYVVFAGRGAGTDAADVFLTTSGDGGATWSTPRRLNDDLTTNDQWLPFVAVAPNGTVGVSWYDRRQDPQNLLIDVFMKFSTDGGASFGQSLKVSDVSFPPRGVTRRVTFPPYSCYMSSYNYMVADATNFYIVWTDNRMVTAGAVDPNIMFAKVLY
jgi:hypothetical protein